MGLVNKNQQNRLSDHSKFTFIFSKGQLVQST